MTKKIMKLIAISFLIIIPNFTIMANAQDPVGVVGDILGGLQERRYENGGTFRSTLGREDVLLPFTSTWSGTIMDLVWDKLIVRTPDMEVIPWLAKSWEIADDAMSVTFYLHENVFFHDGSQLTSEDVKFSYEFAKKHQTRTFANPMSKHIDEITAPDPYTVVFKFKTSSETKISATIVTDLKTIFSGAIASPRTLNEIDIAKTEIEFVCEGGSDINDPILSNFLDIDRKLGINGYKFG